MGFFDGIQAANTIIQQDRAQRQRELTNHIAGYDIQEDGSYEANTIGTQREAITSQKQQQALLSMQATTDLLQATMIAKDFGTVAEHLAMGDTKAAMKQVNNNPILKQKLREQFDAVSVQPVNWATEYKDFEKLGIHINPEDLKDPIKVNALNSTFFKIIKSDGSSEYGSTPVLMRTMNYEQYADEEKLKGMEARFERVQEILSGHLKSPEEKAIEANELKTQIIASSTKLGDVSTQADIHALRNEVIGNIMSSDLTAEEKLAKITEATSTVDYKTLKEQLEVQGKIIDNATKRQKYKDSLPPTGVTDFLKSIDKVEYNDANRALAGKIQGSDHILSEQNKDLLGRMQLTKAFTDVTKSFATKDFDRNAYTSFGNAIAKLSNPDLSIQDREKFLASIEVDTELQAVLAEYIKLMSGAAVSDKERAFYGDLSTAGKWSNKETALTSLKAFTDYIQKSAKGKLDAIKKQYPKTYLDMRDDSLKILEEAKKVTKLKLNDTKISKEVPVAKFDDYVRKHK